MSPRENKKYGNRAGDDPMSDQPTMMDKHGKKIYAGGGVLGGIAAIVIALGTLFPNGMQVRGNEATPVQIEQIIDRSPVVTKMQTDLAVAKTEAVALKAKVDDISTDVKEIKRMLERKGRDDK